MKNKLISRYGLTGTPERIELLDTIADMLDNEEESCIEMLDVMADRWREELEEIFNIDYYKGCGRLYVYEILCNCDDDELQEIISYTNKARHDNDRIVSNYNALTEFEKMFLTECGYTSLYIKTMKPNLYKFFNIGKNVTISGDSVADTPFSSCQQYIWDKITKGTSFNPIK